MVYVKATFQRTYAHQMHTFVIPKTFQPNNDSIKSFFLSLKKQLRQLSCSMNRSLNGKCYCLSYKTTFPSINSLLEFFFSFFLFWNFLLSRSSFVLKRKIGLCNASKPKQYEIDNETKKIQITIKYKWYKLSV